MSLKIDNELRILKQNNNTIENLSLQCKEKISENILIETIDHSIEVLEKIRKKVTQIEIIKSRYLDFDENMGC